MKPVDFSESIAAPGTMVHADNYNIVNESKRVLKVKVILTLFYSSGFVCFVLIRDPDIR